MKTNASFQYMKIRDELISRIRGGALQPGDKLPTEYELMEEFKVSRITAKNALQLLQKQGIIIRERGRGTFLTESGARIVQEEASSAGILSGSARPEENAVLGIVMDSIEESYGLNLFYELDRAASKAGYHLIARMSYGDQARETEEINYLLSLGAKGIFILPARAQFCNTSILKLVLDEYPVLIIDCMLRGIQAHAVSSNNVAGAEMLTQHLIDYGHRHIGLVSVDRSLAVSLEDRYRCYRNALLENNLSFSQSNVLASIQRPARFWQDKESSSALISQLKAFLSDHPEMTAVVVTQYSLAPLVRNAAEQLGKRIPEDLSIVTFDECYDLLGNFTFTHVKQNEMTLAHCALHHMQKLLSREEVPCYEYLMPSLLQGKTSCSVVK